MSLAAIGAGILVILAIGVTIFLTIAVKTDEMRLTRKEYLTPAHPEDLTNFFRAVVGKQAIVKVDKE